MRVVSYVCLIRQLFFKPIVGSLLVIGTIVYLTEISKAENMTASFLQPTYFANLEGWDDDRHDLAFSVFRKSCIKALEAPPKEKLLGIDSKALAIICSHVLSMPEIISVQKARAFFETWFLPFEIKEKGFLTGYFEPILPGSLERNERFNTPIYRRPPDLIELSKTDENRSHIPAEITWARRTEKGLEVFPDRAAIHQGALVDQGLELLWLDNPIDAFFVHIQGSARIELSDGSYRHIGFAGKSGHPYTAIGKTLVARGALALEDVTMDTLKAWLHDHPQEAAAIMATNQSYIFFQDQSAAASIEKPHEGPIAAAGIALTPGRSLAIDRHFYSFGTPIWIDGFLPDAQNAQLDAFHRLMIAQDTGSAIIGPARGDLFIGSGISAGQWAGQIKHPATFTVFLPNFAMLPSDVTQK